MIEEDDLRAVVVIEEAEGEAQPGQAGAEDGDAAGWTAEGHPDILAPPGRVEFRGMEFMAIAVLGPCLFFVGAAIFSALQDKRH